MSPGFHKYNVLVLYDDREMYTPFVSEHVSVIARHSRNRVHYLPATRRVAAASVLKEDDAIIIHFSVRLPFEWHLDPSLVNALIGFDGAKIAMPQDEYDMPHITARRLAEFDVDAIFTTVPSEHRAAFYPPAIVRNIEFYPCLTGYVCEAEGLDRFALPLSERKVALAYRGRILPPIYGALAAEKADAGIRMRQECMARGICCDIEIDENRRLYGDEWYRFLGAARTTFGTESGSNVVDADGSIRALCTALAMNNPMLTEREIYETVVKPHDGHVTMNQISPKSFEAVRLRTGLVLFEGNWPGVLQPFTHYIPLKKDWSNIDSVIDMVMDDVCVTTMTARAHADIVKSGRYSYSTLICRIDDAIDKALVKRKLSNNSFFSRALPDPVAYAEPPKVEGKWPDGRPLTFPWSAPPPPPPPPPPPYKPILGGKLRAIWLQFSSPLRKGIALTVGPALHWIVKKFRTHRLHK